MDVARAPRVSSEPKAKWTVLLYSAADNDLKPYMLDDIREIETIGSDDYTHVVAQVDRGGDEGADRYRLEKSTDPDRISSPVLAHLGPTDMSAPESLADFIAWGMQTYPAEHTLVILSDHGDAWNGALQDESHEGWMSAGEIRQALEMAQAQTGRKVDVLGMDACLMANAEFAYEVKDAADYLVASEQVEGADGWNYTQLLGPQLLANLRTMQMHKIDVAPRDLAVLAVESAEAVQDNLPTMAAIDLAKMPEIASTVKMLGEAIVASTEPDATYRDIANYAENFFGYKDLGDLSARLARSEASGAAVNEAAAAVREAVGQAVIAEQHDPAYGGATGLTIEVDTWGALPEGYTDLAFDRDTQWSVAMQKIALSDEGEEIPLASRVQR